MGRSIRMFSVLVMILLFSSVVHGQRSWKHTLKGIKGVGVLVDVLEPDIEKDGLHRSSIQTDVELKLRMAGIKVLTEEETSKEPGAPYVRVSVFTSIRADLELYVFTIHVALRQLVDLSRDPEIGCVVDTWSSGGSIGTVGSANVASLRDNVKDHVDGFINDYLAENPKE